MNIVTDVFDALLNVLVTLSDRVAPMLPGLIAGMVLLFVGVFLARWVRYGAEQLMEMMTLDDLCGKVGLDHLVQRFGVGRSPARVIGFMVHWAVLGAFGLTAADMVGLPVVRDYLAAFVGFLPGLVSAVVVMGGGLLLARFLGGIVQGAALANQVVESDFMGRSAYWTVAVFSAVIALGRLGIDMTVLTSAPYFMAYTVVVLAAGVLVLRVLRPHAAVDRAHRPAHVAKAR
jgi:hypothetical protein